MTIKQLIKELLRGEIRFDDNVRFYFKDNYDLIGCNLESIEYADNQVEITLEEETYTERKN